MPAAIDDARQNALENGVKNAEFHVGEVERVLPQLTAQGILCPDVVVLDPPPTRVPTGSIVSIIFCTTG